MSRTARILARKLVDICNDFAAGRIEYEEYDARSAEVWDEAMRLRLDGAVAWLIDPRFPDRLPLLKRQAEAYGYTQNCADALNKA